MSNPRAGILAVLVCALAVTAMFHSAHADDQRVVDTMTSTQMRDLLGDEGFTGATIDEDDDVIVRMNGYPVIVFVRENNYTVIRFLFAVIGTNANYRDVNDWNRDRLFTKAYLDGDGDPALEMDMDLTGGVTIANIREAIRTYSQSHVAFLQDVVH